MARKDRDGYKETKSAADSLKVQARSELSNADSTMKDLSSLIREANTKSKAQKDEIEKLKKSGRCGEQALVVGALEKYQHGKVWKELEIVKQKLGLLRLDVAAVSEEKSQKEKQTEALGLKILSYTSNMESIKKDIEEVNEELVLVELAQIEALKEYRDIEAQREKEANQFLCKIEQTREKMKDIIEVIDQSKELESKLAATLSDVDVLENELRVVKEMDKKVRRNENLGRLNATFQREEDLKTSLLLQSIAKELEEAKRELTSVKEEGFFYMTSMDMVRNELKHVMAEISWLKKIEEKSDLTVKNLNSKLLRAKSKSEVVSAAEEKANAIVSNLSLSLEQLKTEAEVANKEKGLIVKEAATIKAEIHETESKMDLTEEQFQATMVELEAVKSLEASALEKLKSLTKNTMILRGCAPKNDNTSITISKFEYEYLIGHAVGAKEIADKKVAAAQAWVKAIKASEKENLIKIELARREITKMRLEEEQQAFRIERSMSAKRMVERELQNWRRKREKNSLVENMQLSLPRRFMRANANLNRSRKGNGNLTSSRKGNGSGTPSSQTNSSSTPSKRAKFRKSASPAARHITIKKRTKVMLNLAKLFSGKRNDKDG